MPYRYPCLKTWRVRVSTFEKVMGTCYPFLLPVLCLSHCTVFSSYLSNWSTNWLRSFFSRNLHIFTSKIELIIKEIGAADLEILNVRGAEHHLCAVRTLPEAASYHIWYEERRSTVLIPNMVWGRLPEAALDNHIGGKLSNIYILPKNGMRRRDGHNRAPNTITEPHSIVGQRRLLLNLCYWLT